MIKTSSRGQGPWHFHVYNKLEFGRLLNRAPVMLPPGPLRLATNPSSTGSLPTANTSRLLGGQRCDGRAGDNDSNLMPYELRSDCRQPIVAALR